MCPGSLYELFYVLDFTKMYQIRTSRLLDFLSEVFRGEIVSRKYIFYSLLDPLTFNKEQFLRNTYTPDFIQFYYLYTLEIYYGFLQGSIEDF